MRKAPIPSGHTVRVEGGKLFNDGDVTQLATWVDDGEYWVVEDLGVKMILQPKGGGANVTARKA